MEKTLTSLNTVKQTVVFFSTVEQTVVSISILEQTVDYSKAYNRMKHSQILINLTALNVPKCAVKLIMSYLTRRSMCVRFPGAVSTFHSCPGGGPQGGLLTGVLFCKAGSPCSLPNQPSLEQNGTHGPTNRPEYQINYASPESDDTELKEADPDKRQNAVQPCPAS